MDKLVFSNAVLLCGHTASVTATVQFYEFTVQKWFNVLSYVISHKTPALVFPYSTPIVWLSLFMHEKINWHNILHVTK
jgi:hypothetical protein